METSEKVVALTFDDGPDEHTQEILDVLSKEKVRATFFVVGSHLQARPQDGRALVTAGHTVMWDIEPGSGRAPTPAELVTEVRAQARPGSIILLHPWYAGGANTRAAIGQLVATLRGDGYRFVTVSEPLG
ncbi:polysaccharide deacetylase family protein [Nonomuraea angiospora]|uniref:polysaccharide deacetylase family protein n=1 Tax=Nonomuraea angiospora TaxID=46172 RepID=UPI00341E465D